MTPLTETLIFALMTYPVVAVLLGGVVLVWWRFRGKPFLFPRLLLILALGLSAYVPVILTSLPVPEDLAAYCARSQAYKLVRLELFDFVQVTYRYLENEDNVRARLHTSFWQVLLNFLMLIPFGVLLNLVWRFGFIRAFVSGLMFSLCLDVTQYTGVWGWFECSYRTFDVDDLVLNAMGASLAAGYVWMTRLVFDRSRQNSLPEDITAGENGPA